MESFDELAVQYQPMIHKIIRSLHIYKNQDEFYQTGLIGLWEATQSFDERKGSFSNYAYSLIRGKLLSQMTQDTSYKDKLIYPKDEFWKTFEDRDSTHFLEKATLQTYCEGLTEKEAKWVIAMAKDQLTIKEIAARENVSVSAVKQWKAGAIRKLKENHNQ